MLSFEQALAVVKDRVTAAKLTLATENLPLEQVRGRVLAEDVLADRDYPPFDRSMRDGYAVRSWEITTAPIRLECVGEARAGAPYVADLAGKRGVSVRIMTGAPLPEGTNAVVMQEYTRAEGGQVEIQRTVEAFENVARRGSETLAGRTVLARGRRLGPGDMGLLASVGQAQVTVFRRPTVALIPTGDEIVPVGELPQWFEVRNSNAIALCGQVEEAGGVPRMVGIAPDEIAQLRRLIEQGLESDLLLLSGGVSVGKYDFVVKALAELGAEFFFESVALRPGKPLVFGRVRDKFFFGLPGNPVSTYVTFELFARPVIGVLSGAEFELPVFLRARLGKPCRGKRGLTTFKPARLANVGGHAVVDSVTWQGSGDLVGMAAANCLLVVRPDQAELQAGDWVEVLPRPA